MGLTRLKQKKRKYRDQNELLLAKAFKVWTEFTDARTSCEHPFVAPSLLAKLRAIDPNLHLFWELQHYFEHRWHVKWKDTLTGELKSVLVLQNPPCPLIHQQADYVPFDSAALHDVAVNMFILRNGKQVAVIEAALQRDQDEADALQADRLDLAFQYDKDHRKIHERLSGRRNISDPGWERGIEYDANGVPITVGAGAHTTNNTKAI